MRKICVCVKYLWITYSELVVSIQEHNGTSVSEKRMVFLNWVRVVFYEQSAQPCNVL